MTKQPHLITPPPELVQKWHAEAMTGFRTNGIYEQDIATLAARWGADQELEACCEWLDFYSATSTARGLRAARRPKPPSLKEQALEALEGMAPGMRLKIPPPRTPSMTDLSPAAQAVLDAAFPVYDEEEHLYVVSGEQHAGMIAAAALRAAVDQVVPEQECQIYGLTQRENERQQVREEILAIAAKLEAHMRPKPPSLKEQALQVLESAPGPDYPSVMTVLDADQHALIRRALEALPE